MRLSDGDGPGSIGSRGARSGAPGPLRLSHSALSETGDITAWNRNAGDTAVVVKPAEPGEDHAIYKGVSILHTPGRRLLLATDFHNGRVDVFDGQFRLQSTPVFSDNTIPRMFAPFNVLAVDDKAYVTYAMQDAAREDDVAGPGLSFVDVFTDLGQTLRRIASNGTLNAPWGLTIAPDGFSQFTGDLLVGNFGDGRINVFRDTTSRANCRKRATRRSSSTVCGRCCPAPRQQAAPGRCGSAPGRTTRATDWSAN